jgi:ComF family protein
LLGDDLCGACKANYYEFQAARSWAIYSGSLRKAILSLKKRQNVALGSAFATRLGRLLSSQHWQPNLVISIPLAKDRQLERGYNQAALLAMPLAEATEMNYQVGGLARVRETSPQFALTARDRWQNLQSAFLAEASLVANKSVLLVDDIMTTGATMNAAAKALREAGAVKVYGLTLARALFERQPEFG